MAVTTGTLQIITLPTTTNNARMRLYNNSWNIPGGPGVLDTQWGVTDVAENTQNDVFTSDESGVWTSNVFDLLADKTYKFRVRAQVYGAPQYGSTKTKKTGALVASISSAGSSSVTATTASIYANYLPNTLESVCTVWLEYKRVADSTWIQAGASDTSQSGYDSHNITRALTGLSPSTQYEFRLQITRNTYNDTTFTSGTYSFTTAAGVPVVTTDPASNIGNTVATINGTLDINEGTGLSVYFKWGTDNPPTQNTTTPQPKSFDTTFLENLSGLTQSTTYYFQAFATFSYPSGSPVSGAVVSFQTTVDPGVAAAAEARMQVYEYKRKYGVLLATGASPLLNGPLFFTLQSPASVNSDTFVVGASFAAGDVKVSKDGGSFSNTTNLPATVGSGYTLILTAAELQANEIDVIIKDQDGPAFRDCHLRIITHVQLGSVAIDAASGAKANTTAFSAIGYGSGHGISAVKGATGSDIDGVLAGHVLRHNLIGTGAANPVLDAGASSVNDFYNNMLLIIIAGTGAGQARIIKDYDGATLTVTPNRAWSTNPGTGAEYVIIPGEDTWNVSPGAELTAIPTFASSFGQLLQLLFQRFAYKITQTATVQTFYKSTAGGATALGTRTVGDDGSTQTIGELS